jgi:hypothetical protein
VVLAGAMGLVVLGAVAVADYTRTQERIDRTEARERAENSRAMAERAEALERYPNCELEQLSGEVVCLNDLGGEVDVPEELELASVSFSASRAESRQVGASESVVRLRRCGAHRPHRSNRLRLPPTRTRLVTRAG